MDVISDKIVIVTEADSNIGLCLVEILLRRGGKVVMMGRSSQEMDDIVKKYGSQNCFVVPMETVTSGIDSYNAAVESAVAQFGAIDILICCARPLETCTTESATAEAVRKMWNESVMAPFHLIKASLEHLKKSKGSVVLLSSFECRKPNDFLQSLAAINRDCMVRLVAQEMKSFKIRFNAVSPYGCQQQRSNIQSLIEKIYSQFFGPPLGRKVKSTEVAELLAFVASNSLSSVVTGNNFFIDGGLSITSPPSYSSLLTLLAVISHNILTFLRFLGLR